VEKVKNKNHKATQDSSYEFRILKKDNQKFLGGFGREKCWCWWVPILRVGSVCFSSLVDITFGHSMKEGKGTLH